MAQTNGGQPQVTNKITFAISWVHTMWTSVLYVSKAAVVFTHFLYGMLAQHKTQCTLSALLYSVLVNTRTHCMQAAAQQTQEAQPNAHNAESARHWIAAWRSKVAVQLTAAMPTLITYLTRAACNQQAPSAKASDVSSNGARQNGSTPANQDGQAIAPKLPGEAPPKAKPKSQPAKGFNNVNKYSLAASVHQLESLCCWACHCNLVHSSVLLGSLCSCMS